MCCGDINDSVKPPVVLECPEKRLACSFAGNFEAREALFEQHFQDIINYGFAQYDGTESLIPLDDQILAQFVGDFDIAGIINFNRCSTANSTVGVLQPVGSGPESNVTVLPIDATRAYLQFTDEFSTGIQRKKFSLLFPTTDRQDTSLYGIEISLTNITRLAGYQLLDIESISCLDVSPSEVFFLNFGFRTKSGNQEASSFYGSGFFNRKTDASGNTIDAEGNSCLMEFCTFLNVPEDPNVPYNQDLICENGDPDLSKKFAYHFKNFLQSVISSGLFNTDKDFNRLSLKNFPSYNRFLQDYLTKHSALKCNSTPDLCFYNGATNFSDLENMFLYFNSNNNRLMIANSDIQSLNIEISDLEGITIESKIENILVENYTNGRSPSAIIKLENGKELNITRMFMNMNNIHYNNTSTSRSQNNIGFNCQLFNFLPDYPNALPIQQLDNSNTYFLDNAYRINEDLYELYLKEIMNMYYVEGASSIQHSNLESKDLNLLNLWKNFITKFHQEEDPNYIYPDVSENMLPFAYAYNGDPFNRVIERGSFQTIFLGNPSDNFAGPRISIIFEEDFNDVKEVLEVYLLRESHPSVVYGSIRYVNTNNEEILAKNVVFSSFFVNRSRHFIYPSMSELLSQDISKYAKSFSFDQSS